MHPAASVIFFTTLSGAGYGLLFVSILGNIFGFYQASQTELLICISLAFVMVTAGLMSSTFHLGHPERAWRAFSQWRTSWLSREGVCAVLTYIPWAIFTATLLFIEAPKLQLWAGFLAAILAMLTVFTTSMIYRSLKAIQAWYNVYVSPLYLIFSITTGLILLNLVLFMTVGASEQVNNLALVTLIATFLLKRAYWRSISKQQPRSTMESATGLGEIGKVSALERPHTETNYLLQEMGYQIARKHSIKLKNIFSLVWIVAVVCTALSLVFTGTLSILMVIFATIAVVIGVGVERWLFFAEAKHTQALYYGQS